MSRPFSTRAPKIIGWIALVLFLGPFFLWMSSLVNLLHPRKLSDAIGFNNDPYANAGMVVGMWIVFLFLFMPLIYNIGFLRILAKSPENQLSRGQSRFLLLGFILMLFSILLEAATGWNSISSASMYYNKWKVVLYDLFALLPFLHLYLIITGLRLRQYSKRASREQLINALDLENL